MMMKAKILVQIQVTALLLLAGCAEDIPRGCLGGVGSCGDIIIQSQLQTQNTTVPTENENSTANPNAFSCTATPFPAQVLPGQTIRLQVDTVGGSGNKSIVNPNGGLYIQGFSSRASIYGQYTSDKAGTVVERSVDVVDSAGIHAYCSFKVQVLDPNAPNQGSFQCQITPSPAVVNAGGTVQFNLTATGATGQVHFNSFYASNSWKVPDNFIQSTGPNSAAVSVQYDQPGVKTLSVVANGAGQGTLCTANVTVKLVGNPPGPGPLLGCNVETAPMGYAAPGSLPSLAGTVTRLRAVPVGGFGPFSASLIAIDENGASVPYDYLTGLQAAHPGDLHVRFRKAGNFRVQLRLQDLAGGLVSCSTTHISSAPNTYATSGPQGLPAYVLKGTNGSQLEIFSPFGSANLHTVKLAQADVNADGFLDLIAIVNNTIRILRGRGTAHFAGKGSPELLVSDHPANVGEGNLGIHAAAGDVDGDGFADIVMANGCSASFPRIRILSGRDINNVLASFQPPAHLGNMASIAVADVNADGYSDVIASACTGGVIKVFDGKNIRHNRQCATPNLMPTVIWGLGTTASVTGATVVAAGDVNYDGRADIVSGVLNGAGVRVTIRHGHNGHFIKTFDSLPTNSDLVSAELAAGDLNADGFADIFVLGRAVNAADHFVEVYDAKTLLQQNALSFIFSFFLDFVDVVAGTGGL